MQANRRVAIVTGAAQGIGRATAWRLARQGIDVFLADLQAEKAAAEAAAMRAAGLTAESQKTDVGDPIAIKAMVAGAVEAFGRLDILVNNAAILDIYGTAEDTTPATWNRGFDVMVRAIALASGEAAPYMRQAGGGAIVNISSVHGLLAATKMAVYDTCKHAVIGLTRAMAIDFGPDNIRVNAICPGYICTEVRDEAWRSNIDEALHSEMISPLRRVGRPADIAAAVSYLVSDDAAFVSGHALVVDGGLSIQLQDSFAARVRAYVKDGPAVRSLRTPPVGVS